MSATPPKEAEQVPGTPCITMTEFTSAFAHPAGRWHPQHGREGAQGCARRGCARSPAHGAHLRPGLHPRARRRLPAGIRTFPSKGGRRFPAERGFAAGRGRGRLGGPAGARRGRVARPAERSAGAGGPALGTDTARAGGTAHGTHGHRRRSHRPTETTLRLADCGTDTCLSVHCLSLSTFVREDRAVFLERHTLMCLHGGVFPKAHRTSIIQCKCFRTMGGICNRTGVISEFAQKG